jgi:hypothetical protein
MEQRPTQGAFYGSAIAALGGLLIGLLLHGAWQKRPGGPQILLASPAAAEPARPAADDQPSAARGGAVLAGLDPSRVAPDPLPVTRLAPDMFDVQPAATGGVERQDVGDQVADAAPQAPPRRATSIRPGP